MSSLQAENYKISRENMYFCVFVPDICGKNLDLLLFLRGTHAKWHCCERLGDAWNYAKTMIYPHIIDSKNT